MGFETPDGPEEQRTALEAMLKTLGPVMRVSGWDAVMAMVETADGERLAPHVILRYDGMQTDKVEVVTQTVLLSMTEVENMVHTLVAQMAVLTRSSGQQWLSEHSSPPEDGC